MRDLWERDRKKQRHAEEGKASGCVGVNWDKGSRAWIAKIGYAGKQYAIIRTKDLDLAIKAREEAEEAVKNGGFEEFIKTKRNNK
mgnify:FL=1